MCRAGEFLGSWITKYCLGVLHGSAAMFAGEFLGSAITGHCLGYMAGLHGVLLVLSLLGAGPVCMKCFCWENTIELPMLRGNVLGAPMHKPLVCASALHTIFVPLLHATGPIAALVCCTCRLIAQVCTMLGTLTLGWGMCKLQKGGPELPTCFSMGHCLHPCHCCMKQSRLDMCVASSAAPACRPCEAGGDAIWCVLALS